MSCKNCSCGENFCEKKKPKCVEDCEQQYIDTKEVRYKINCEGYSELESLNIHKGDTLEYILEVFGQSILDFNFIQNPSIKEKPNLKTLEDIILFLYERNKYLESKLESTMCSFMKTLESFNDRIYELEMPELKDTNAIGFTKMSNLKSVLQTIIDKI